MNRAGSSFIIRGLLLAALVAVVPACGNGGNNNGPAAPAQPTQSGPKTLFSDDFSGAFPGQNWTAPTSTHPADGSPNPDGKAVIDPAFGNPAPSLSMTSLSGPCVVQTQCNAVIMDPGFTASVDLAVQADGEGSGAMDILNQSAAPIAAVEWHPATVGGAITFMITDPAAPAAPHVVSFPPPASGPTFHTFTFSVDGSGNAKWSMDGNAPVLTATGFPTGIRVLRLYDQILTATGPFATFHYDNVKITVP